MLSRLPIRYLATTDESHYGKLALEYLKALLKVGRVNVGAISGQPSTAWLAFSALMTPPQGRFVNVVCCVPERWAWTQRFDMPTKPAAFAEGTPTETRKAEAEVGRIELYTAGVRNVLIAGCVPKNAEMLATALKYEALLVPTPEIYDAWDKAGAAPRWFPVPIDDIRAFHGVVMP